MKLISTSRFYLAGTQKEYLHLATVHHGIREYMCFARVSTGQVYLEEVTGGSLNFIEDDSLVNELYQFLDYYGVLDMTKPLLSDNQYHGDYKKIT